MMIGVYLGIFQIFIPTFTQTIVVNRLITMVIYATPKLIALYDKYAN